jgi:hypothetical protein
MVRPTLVLLMFALAGCAVVKPVSDAARVDDIDARGASLFDCEKPYAFTRGCSSWNGGAYRVVIEDHDINLAFSADGRVVLIADAHSDRHAIFSMPFTFNLSSLSKAVNRSYVLVREVLDNSGIAVHRVRAIKISRDIVWGYVLELEADGYAALAAYSRQPQGAS